MPETDQSSINVYKTRDLQIASVATSTATKSFSMAHKMGLIQINMKKATAPETRTYTANSVTKAYDSGNVEFYALNVFDGTNLPYSSSCPGTVSYFIVKYSSGNYSFTTPYKALNNGSTTGAVSQWTMSAVTAPASGKCTSATTGNPVFKNLGRLYSYTNTVQTYTPILTEYKYKMECWGGEGGCDLYSSDKASTYFGYGGKGGYTKGILKITQSIINRYPVLYVYVGDRGYSNYERDRCTTNMNAGGWGGSAQGGGCTDIRLVNGTWSDVSSLCSRIMVAGGGGGGENCNGEADGDFTHYGAAAGGLYGYSSSASTTEYYYAGGSQTTGKGFGVGRMDQSGVSNGHWWGGGGNGYWSGYTAFNCQRGVAGGGGGGSSFISGHAGCVALSSSTTDAGNLSFKTANNSVASATHYSGVAFEVTQIIDGKGHEWTTSAGTIVNAMPCPTTTGNYTNDYYTYGAGIKNVTWGTYITYTGYARITCTPYD